MRVFQYIILSRTIRCFYFLGSYGKYKLSYIKNNKCLLL